MEDSDLAPLSSGMSRWMMRERELVVERPVGSLSFVLRPLCCSLHSCIILIEVHALAQLLLDDLDCSDSATDPASALFDNCSLAVRLDLTFLCRRGTPHLKV